MWDTPAFTAIATATPDNDKKKYDSKKNNTNSDTNGDKIVVNNNFPAFGSSNRGFSRGSGSGTSGSGGNPLFAAIRAKGYSDAVEPSGSSGTKIVRVALTK